MGFPTDSSHRFLTSTEGCEPQFQCFFVTKEYYFSLLSNVNTLIPNDWHFPYGIFKCNFFNEVKILIILNKFLLRYVCIVLIDKMINTQSINLLLIDTKPLPEILNWYLLAGLFWWTANSTNVDSGTHWEFGWTGPHPYEISIKYMIDNNHEIKESGKFCLSSIELTVSADLSLSSPCVWFEVLLQLGICLGELQRDQT